MAEDQRLVPTQRNNNRMVSQQDLISLLLEQASVKYSETIQVQQTMFKQLTDTISTLAHEMMGHSIQTSSATTPLTLTLSNTNTGTVPASSASLPVITTLPPPPVSSIPPQLIFPTGNQPSSSFDLVPAAIDTGSAKPAAVQSSTSSTSETIADVIPIQHPPVNKKSSSRNLTPALDASFRSSTSVTAAAMISVPARASQRLPAKQPIVLPTTESSRFDSTTAAAIPEAETDVAVTAPVLSNTYLYIKDSRDSHISMNTGTLVDSGLVVLGDMERDLVATKAKQRKFLELTNKSTVKSNLTSILSYHPFLDHLDEVGAVALNFDYPNSTIDYNENSLGKFKLNPPKMNCLHHIYGSVASVLPINRISKCITAKQDWFKPYSLSNAYVDSGNIAAGEERLMRYIDKIRTIESSLDISSLYELPQQLPADIIPIQTHYNEYPVSSVANRTLSLKQFALPADAEENPIPGVSTEYSYYSRGGSVFAAHFEDAALNSINIMFNQCPEFDNLGKFTEKFKPNGVKRFYSVAAKYVDSFMEYLCEVKFPHAFKNNKDAFYYRTMFFIPTAEEMDKFHIRALTVCANQIFVSAQGSLHWGYNIGATWCETQNCLLTCRLCEKNLGIRNKNERIDHTVNKIDYISFTKQSWYTKHFTNFLKALERTGVDLKESAVFQTAKLIERRFMERADSTDSDEDKAEDNDNIDSTTDPPKSSKRRKTTTAAKS